MPKLHAKGTSFRGAAAYLLHDKGRARSSDRVAWTQTRNLATDDPHQAWRVMAAVAVDRERIKAWAGVKNTGRKSADVVLHLTLSWHADEKDGLTREEMVRAAAGALRALRAEDRQALLVCHDDEPQPHVHVLINRVSPADGRMLSSSKEKLALSRWAQAYEQERGRILCEERVLNNAARDRGEFVRGEPDAPRHVFELEAANDGRPDAGKVRDEQRRLDADAARDARRAKRRHAEAKKELARRHRQRVAEIRARAGRAAAAEVRVVRDRFRDQWRALFHEHRTAERDFEEREPYLLGRVQNALRAIDLGEIVRAGDRRRAIGEVFQALSSSGARLEGLKRRQTAEHRKLAARQRAEENKALDRVREQRRAELAENRGLFQVERSELELGQRMDAAAVRARWRTRGTDRSAAWTSGRERATSEGAPDQRPREAGVADELIEAMRARQRRRQERRDRGRDPGNDRGR